MLSEKEREVYKKLLGGHWYLTDNEQFFTFNELINYGFGQDWLGEVVTEHNNPCVFHSHSTDMYFFNCISSPPPKKNRKGNGNSHNRLLFTHSHLIFFIINLGNKWSNPYLGNVGTSYASLEQCWRAKNISVHIRMEQKLQPFCSCFHLKSSLSTLMI